MLSSITVRNIKLRYALAGLQQSVFTVSIWIIAGTYYFQFSHTQILVLTMVGFLSYSVCQLPTGVLADSWGRKRALIVGNVLGLLAALPFIFTTNFWLLLLSRPLFGLGSALQFGPLAAIGYDDLTRDTQPERYPRIAAHAQTISYVMQAIAGLAGGFLYEVDPRWPFIAHAMTYVLAIPLSMALIVRTTVPSRTSSSQVQVHFRQVVTLLRRERYLSHFLVVLGILTAAKEFLWYGYQPYFVSIGFPFHVIGYCYAAFFLFAALGSQVTRRLTMRISIVRIVQLILFLQVLTCVSLLTLKSSAGMIMPIVLSLTLGVPLFLVEVFTNRYADSSYRVTALSAATAIVTVAATVSDLVLGLASDHLGLSAGPLIALALSLAVLFVLVKCPLNTEFASSAPRKSPTAELTRVELNR